MANLQIKGIDDDFYDLIKEIAASENRSVSQQVIFLVKQYVNRKKNIDKIKNPAQVLLDLSGSWQDDRTAKKIIEDITGNRKNSRKLVDGL